MLVTVWPHTITLPTSLKRVNEKKNWWIRHQERSTVEVLLSYCNMSAVACSNHLQLARRRRATGWKCCVWDMTMVSDNGDLICIVSAITDYGEAVSPSEDTKCDISIAGFDWGWTQKPCKFFTMKSNQRIFVLKVSLTEPSSFFVSCLGFNQVHVFFFK